MGAIIPKGWRREIADDSPPSAPSVRLCLAPAGKVAGALERDGATLDDVRTDLSRGVLLRRVPGDGLFELSGWRYRLLIARGVGRLSGAPIAFIRAAGPRPPFDDAPIEGSEITCPRHGARFCLRTGEVLSPPAYEPLRLFAVRESAGRIEVQP